MHVNKLFAFSGNALRYKISKINRCQNVSCVYNSATEKSFDEFFERTTASNNEERLFPKKKKKNEEENRSSRLSPSELFKPLSGPDFYVENGLKKVRPFHLQFATSTKERWLNRTVIDVCSKEFHKRTKSFFNDQIKFGRIKVNNKEITEDYVLKHGDVITNVVHRHELPTLNKSVRVLVDNEDVLVVDKPCSFVMSPISRYYYGSLAYQLQSIHGLNEIRSLYRLDRLTSGLVIVAKTFEVDLKLKTQMINHQLRKEYVARVVGEFPSKRIVCDQPIGLLIRAMGVSCASSLEPKSCTTVFERMFYDGKSSVVRCFPKTGRTHQIRVHLQYLGYPIVNDCVYNIDAWGPNRGKGCDYGKSREQLIDDISKELDHNQRFVDFDESIEEYSKFRQQFTDPKNTFLKHLVNEVQKRDKYYDPLCPDCHLKPIEPKLDELEMYLHCLKYEGPDWSYSTDLPDWAKPEWKT